MDFVALLGSRAVNITLTVLAVLLVIGHVWSITRLAIQTVKGRAPSGTVVDIFDVVAIVGPSLFGGLDRYLKVRGGEGLFAKPGESLKGDGGSNTPRPPPLPALFFGLMLMAILGACSGARSRLVDITPTTPPRASTPCVSEAQACIGKVPSICMEDEEGSTVMRWWPMHPLSEQGTPAECANRCVMTGNVAHCAEAE